MLNLIGEKTVWDSDKAGGNISSENFSEQTIYQYSNEWCGNNHPYFPLVS